jgi:WD40 repeat protein
LYDLASGTLVREMMGHTNAVWRLTFSADGTRLASGTILGQARLWDVLSGADLTPVGLSYGSDINTATLSPDGQLLTLGLFDGTVVLREADTGRDRQEFSGEGAAVMSLTYSRDGTLLAAGGSDGGVRLWDVASGRELQRLGVFATGTIIVQVWSVAFSPDAALLATVSTSYDISQGGLRRPFVPDVGATLPMYHVTVWEVATGRPLTILTGHLGDVRGLAFSPDGKLLATGSVDGTIRLWGPP